VSDITVSVTSTGITVSVVSSSPGAISVGQQGPAGPPVPAGTNTRVLFSDNEAVGTHSGFTFDKTTGQLTLPGLVEQYNGATPQGFRLYNNRIDAANYERGGVEWNGTVLRFFTERAGTGAARGIVINSALGIQIGTSGTGRLLIGIDGHILPDSVDNTYDFGSVTWKFRSGHFGTSVIAPRLESATITFGGSGVNNAVLGSAALGLSSAHFLGWSGTADANSGTWDTRLHRDASSALALRGTTAAAFRMYEAFTDASNYSRLNFNYNTSALSFHISSQAAGTGTLRGLLLDGTQVLLATSGTTRYAASATDFSPYTNTGTDKTLDLGKATTRWRDARIGRHLYLDEKLILGAGAYITGSATLGGTIINTSSDLANVVMFREDQDTWLFGHTSPHATKNGAIDLGESGQQWRNGYFSSTVFTPGITSAAGVNLLLNAGTGASVHLQSGGTSRWALDGQTNAFRPLDTNAYDLGSATATVRTGRFGTSVIAPLFDVGDGGIFKLTSQSSTFQGAANSNYLGSLSGYPFLNAASGWVGYLAVGNAAVLQWGIGGIRLTGGYTAWNTTTPGTTVGAVHLGDGGSLTGFSGPAITFGARDSGSGGTAQAGIYSVSDGTVGTELYLASGGSYVTGAQMGFKLDNAQNVHAWKPGAGIYAWNVRTDAANYERGVFGFSGSVLYVGTEAAGTGSIRNVVLKANDFAIQQGGTNKWTFAASGNILAGTDNAYDVGAAATSRPRDIHVARTVYSPLFASGAALAISAGGAITITAGGSPTWTMNTSGHLSAGGAYNITTTGLVTTTNLTVAGNPLVGSGATNPKIQFGSTGATALALRVTAAASDTLDVVRNDEGTYYKMRALSFVAVDGITAAGTSGIGYATGAGGTVTQLTNKNTGVTLNKVTGVITMAAGSLAADGVASFVFTNSTIAASDHVLVDYQAGGTGAAYHCDAVPAAGSATIHVRNVTTGALNEAIQLRFTVIKSVNA
jgi:hypothetical protein